MKKLIILAVILPAAIPGFAQLTFKSDMDNARTAYAAGKLEDTHFALQQAMAEMDIIVGKKILQILPPKMDTLSANTAQDNVFANAGFLGATVHRTWGGRAKTADLSIIDNSPLISTLNTFLNMPMMGSFMNSDKSKTVKVQGYKARLENEGTSTNGSASYSLEIPLSNTLITFKLNNTTDAEILNLANSLPLAQIAKLVQ